jgi:hypothetical protein
MSRAAVITLLAAIIHEGPVEPMKRAAITSQPAVVVVSRIALDALPAAIDGNGSLIAA